MDVFGSKLPPEIWELSQHSIEAHWWSITHPGQMPGAGKAVDSATNAVPGSSVTTAQTDTSAMPGSVRRGLSFEGDDALDSTPDFQVEQVTYGAVMDVDNVTGRQVILDIRSASTDAVMGLYSTPDQPNVELFMRSDDGSSGALSSVSVDSRVPTAAVVTFDWSASSPRVRLTARNRNAEDTQVNTLSGGSVTDLNGFTVGYSPGNPRYLNGDLSEWCVAYGYAVPDVWADTFCDRMYWRHGLEEQ